MASYQYRAVDAQGRVSNGRLDAADRARAIAEIRRSGAIPIDIAEALAERGGKPVRIDGKLRAAVRKLVAELAVLLNAGLPLDRALALAIENVEPESARAPFVAMLEDVREGLPLSQAMAKRAALSPPTAQAMAEAGEANGRLGDALARLAAALDSTEELRRLLVSSMIYPVVLLVIAIGVILMMLLFVVPQFESLFATAQDKLPASSRTIMAASRALREHGLVILAGLVGLGFGLRQLAGRPAVRRLIDRLVLRLPQVGTLVSHFETARFARTLGVLLEGEVALPTALLLARRAISNGVIGGAVGKVANGVKEGEGLYGPLAASGVFPRIALGFLRTGEETSRLPLMLGRLADVMDADVKVRLQRVIALLTPLITVVMGASVAAIIASIMSAILGFNDLAVSQ